MNEAQPSSRNGPIQPIELIGFLGLANRKAIGERQGGWTRLPNWTPWGRARSAPRRPLRLTA
jgi:hypothetical protein